MLLLPFRGRPETYLGSGATLGLKDSEVMNKYENCIKLPLTRGTDPEGKIMQGLGTVELRRRAKSTGKNLLRRSCVFALMILIAMPRG